MFAQTYNPRVWVVKVVEKPNLPNLQLAEDLERYRSLLSLQILEGDLQQKPELFIEVEELISAGFESKSRIMLLGRLTENWDEFKAGTLAFAIFKDLEIDSAGNWKTTYFVATESIEEI